MTLPNKLTVLRIALIPVMVACFYIPLQGALYVALAVFVIAYATDALDGYIARKYSLISDFGKLMDPIADKLLSCSALIMLCANGMISPIPIIIIIAREFIISGLRLVAAGNGSVIAASKWGKAKTMSQFIAICFSMVQTPLRALCGFALDTLLVWIATALTVISLIEFMVSYRSMIASKKS